MHECFQDLEKTAQSLLHRVYKQSINNTGHSVLYGRYFPVLRALHCSTRSTNSQMMLMICFQRQKGSSIVGAEKKNDQNWSYSKCHAKDAAVAVRMQAHAAIILSPNEYNNLER